MRNIKLSCHSQKVSTPWTSAVINHSAVVIFSIEMFDANDCICDFEGSVLQK